MDPKDKYLMKDWTVERERSVLEFMVPIFYLKKPTRVTVTLGNTIFG